MCDVSKLPDTVEIVCSSGSNWPTIDVLDHRVATMENEDPIHGVDSSNLRESCESTLVHDALIHQQCVSAMAIVVEQGSHATDRRAADEPLIIEADEIVFKAGAATLRLKKENGGTIDIEADTVNIFSRDVVTEAEETHLTKASNIVSVAGKNNELRGKLVKVNGDLVMIN